MRRIVPLAQEYDRLPKPQMLVSSGMTRFPFVTTLFHDIQPSPTLHTKDFWLLYPSIPIYIYITYIIFTCVHVFIIHWFVF